MENCFESVRIFANNCGNCQYERSQAMNRIITDIIRVAVGAAGLAVCRLIDSALKDEVNGLCDFSQDDF